MNRPTACTYLLYVVLDQYYLYCPSRFTDSRGGLNRRVFTDGKLQDSQPFCGKLPGDASGALSGPRSHAPAPAGQETPPAGRTPHSGRQTPPRGTFRKQPRIAFTHSRVKALRAYSLMRRSCAGGMRGGEGSMTSAAVTVP